jgi:hypothetical protein
MGCSRKFVGQKVQVILMKMVNKRKKNLAENWITYHLKNKRLNHKQLKQKAHRK